jgi:hypothetical protein
MNPLMIADCVGYHCVRAIAVAVPMVHLTSAPQDTYGSGQKVGPSGRVCGDAFAHIRLLLVTPTWLVPELP